MTLDERIVVEAYTGYVMTGGQDNPKENGLCHKYIEQKWAVRFGRMNLPSKKFRNRCAKLCSLIF